MTFSRRILAVLVGLAFIGGPRSVQAAKPDSYYSEGVLTEAELAGKSLRELELMRATIHARGGLVFLPAWLHEHFVKQSFYQAGVYDEGKLSDVDRKNLVMLERHVVGIPRAELEKRWAALLERHRHVWTSYGRPFFSTDGRMLVTVRAHPQPNPDFPPPSRLERVGEPALVTLNAQTGSLLASVAWPLRETKRLLHRTGSGERVITQRVGELIAYRLVGRELVAVTDYNVFIGDPRAAQPAKTLLIAPDWARKGGRGAGMQWACVAPDGSAVLAYAGGQLSLFDLRAGVQSASVALPPDSWGGGCSFLDAKLALVTDSGGAHFIFQVTTKTLEALEASSGSAVLSPDRSLLATWSYFGKGETSEISLWDMKARREHGTLQGSLGGAAAFSPDGRRLLASDSSGAIDSWDVRNFSRTVWQPSTDVVYSREVDPCEGSHDLGLGTDWDKSHDSRLERSRSKPSFFTFSPDGRRVAVVREEGTLELRDLGTRQRVETFRGHEQLRDEDVVEAGLLAQRLGQKIPPGWRRLPMRNALKHLNALDQPLAPEALVVLSRSALRTLRTAVCARRGCPVASRLLKERLHPWYEPSPKYTPALLTAVDRANLLAIRRRENELGGPITEAEDNLVEGNWRRALGEEGAVEELPHPPVPRRVGFPPLPAKRR